MRNPCYVGHEFTVRGTRPVTSICSPHTHPVSATPPRNLVSDDFQMQSMHDSMLTQAATCSHCHLQLLTPAAIATVTYLGRDRHLTALRALESMACVASCCQTPLANPHRLTRHTSTVDCSKPKVSRSVVFLSRNLICGLRSETKTPQHWIQRCHTSALERWQSQHLSRTVCI